HDHDHDEEEHEHDHDEEEHDHDHDEEEHDHDHDEDDHEHLEDGSCCDDEEDHDHSHYDEHVWLSLDNAKYLVDKLLDEVVALTPENTDAFTTRAEDYMAELELLDDKYESVIGSSSRDVILIADRFPLRYLVDDYDLDYYAAFSGCSAEAEVSFETIKFLTDKVDELDLTTILIMDGSTQDMAQTIINNSSSDNNIDILTFNSMQSITNSDVQTGISYLDIMLSNLEDVLIFALN
ncbi:MAG: metal ABC transporter substrate-binding protein, partial [bacterium]